MTYQSANEKAVLLNPRRYGSVNAAVAATQLRYHTHGTSPTVPSVDPAPAPQIRWGVGRHPPPERVRRGE